MAKAKVTMPEITIEQPGFIYIFVYNRSDSPNWVFFDEMLVTHEHSAVVAGADYYPFGLAMDGREITDEPYRWGYQGQYAQENDSTGWNEFQLRMYDARFGRWLSVDPHGQFWSPYVGIGNAPNMGVDPDGGWSWVTAGAGFLLGGAIGYAASDGDWGWALAGAIGGGLIGGASFDQSFRGWDGGTRGATKALVLKPTSFGTAAGELLASVGREYLAFQANPRAQLAYNAFTQVLVNLGQAAGEKEYVIENVRNGNYKFRSQYKFNRLTGDVSDCCWKIDPSIDITAAIGSRDLFVHNLRDPETKAVFNINYYGPQGGSGIVNGHVMYDNLVAGFIAGNALFRGGPSIALTRGENDIIIFSFLSIHSRNSFFRHYFNKGKNHQLKDMARRFPQ